MTRVCLTLCWVVVGVYAAFVVVTDTYGANPAFVASPPSQQVVSAKGFNPGERGER